MEKYKLSAEERAVIMLMQQEGSGVEIWRFLNRSLCTLSRVLTRGTGWIKLRDITGRTR